MKKTLSMFLVLVMIVSCLAVFPAMADGEITGTVWGNGSVSFENGENGVTFTLTPGAANEVKSFTVDGSLVEVTDNKATVSSASTYEAVFEGKAQSITRETPKVVMENGVVANDGLSVKDSVNKLQMSRNSGGGSVPAFGTAGYEISRTGNNQERMTLQREPADGGLARTAVGRTYEPVIYYTNTHPEWNINVWFYQVQIYTGFMNDSNTRIFINGCNDSWHAKAAAIKTTNTVSNSTVGRAVPGAAFAVESFTDSDRKEITDKSVYATLRRAIFINPGIGGYGDGHVYVSGISFNETVPYHAIKSEIGEGTMTVSSESLNFGKDNDNVKVKSGTAFAVEDKRNAKVTVKAPENSLIEKLTYTKSDEEPTEIADASGKSIYELDLNTVEKDGTISATYTQGDFYNLSINISGGNASVTYGGETYTESKTVKTVGAADKATITAAKGFEIESVTYDGSQIELKSKKTVSVNIENKEATLAVVIKPSEDGGVTLYVSPEGSANPDGTIDNPFKTPEEALGEVKRLKDNDLLDEGTITVYLRGGTYNRTSSLSFDSSNSGTETSPIVIASYPGERAKFSGGLKLDPSTVQKVTDENILNRIIDPYAKTKLVQVDLGAAGAKNLYNIPDSGYSHPWVTEFFMNGSAMTIARWPNDEKTDAFVKVASVEGSDKSKPITIGYDDPTNRAQRWGADAVKSMYIKGGLATEYTIAFSRVSALNAEENKVTTKKSIEVPGTKWGKFYFMNILDEIDVPGEYFIDNENKMLYFYPISDDIENSELVVSQLEDAVIKGEGAAWITLKDLDFAYSKMTPVNIKGNHITIDGCTVSDIGENAVTAVGTDITVKNCNIFDIAGNGINLECPEENREKLIPDGNRIINNRIHNTSRISQSVSYPVTIGYANGLEIANNEIYDCSGMAIRLWRANDVTIRDNEIYNALRYTSDNGAIYWGRDITTLGNRVLHNYIHDVGNEYGGYGTQGVFTDDCGSGPYMADNILYKAGTYAYKTNCGNYSKLENNLIIDTPNAGYFQVVPQSRYWLKVVGKWPNKDGSPDPWGQWTYNKGEQYMKNELWKEHYKGTQWENIFSDFSIDLYNQIKDLSNKEGTEDANKLLEFAAEHAPKNVNYFGENALFGTPVGYEAAIKGTNYSTAINDRSKAYFKDYGKDFSLTEEGLAAIRKSVPGFENISMEGIGLTSAVGGNKPNASALVLTKNADGIKLGYRFEDADSDHEGFTKVNWYVSDSENGEYTLIRDKHDRVLPLDDSLKGKFVYAELTVYDAQGLHGETVKSDAVNTDKTEDLSGALKEQLDEANRLLENVEKGESFGQIKEEDYNKLKSAVDNAKTADMETVISVKEAIGNFKSAINQKDGEVSGTLPIFSFMTDKTFEITDNSALKLEAGKALPKVTVSGYVTIDGTKQPATLTIPKGTVIEGSGFVTVNLFGEKASPSVSVEGEKITALKLTDEKINASADIELTVGGGFRKTVGYVNGTAVSLISGSNGYTKEKFESDGVKIKTTKLGEIVFYTKSANQTDDPTPDNPGGGGGGTTTKPSGNKGTNGFYSGETTNPSISNPFTDMVNHWAAADVLAMNKAGIVSGVSDTLFDPDRNITRAEFAAIIARALKLNDKTADYKDVSDEWFAPYVGASSDAGIISGYDGYFRPNDNITRQEMAVIIVNAYSYLEKQGANGGIDNFTDKAKIADWAKAAVDTASSVGLISGMGDGTFSPSANATRAQAASIVRRLLG